VRVAAGDDAATTGAATASRQISVIEAHATRCQSIGVWGLYRRMAITAEILLGDIISNEENNVCRFGREGSSQAYECGKDGQDTGPLSHGQVLV